MKKLLLMLSIIMAANSLSAQDFQGMAVYASKTSTADMKSRLDGNKDITPEMRKMIEERMKSMFEKTFILNFDKTTSTYKEEEKLDAPGQEQGGFRMVSSMMGGGGTYFKNIKDKTYTVDKEFMGKEFLVNDTLTNMKWKMTSETKQIGGYNCFKATAVIAASKSDIRNFRPKNPDEAKKDADKNQKTNIMDEVDIPKEITITAWYTPEIPVSQGPESYWGLPGLILEANDGKTVILCTKVVLNPKEKAEIKAPTKGQKVKQPEYDDIVMKKLQELRDMNGGRPGMQMRIGN